MKRRNFIYLSTLSTFGVIVTSSKVSHAVDRRSVLIYAQDFGYAIGFPMVATSVDSYLRTPIDPSLNEVIYGTNAHVSQMGFNNFSNSNVYQAQNNLYYPVQHQDGINLCVPFLTSGNSQPTLVTLLEGPSLIGITKAAEEIRTKYSAKIAKAVLYPVQELNPGQGTFETGYETPARYITSDDRCVTIDYQNISPREGKVEVTVEKPSGSGMKELFHQTYDVGYI